MKISYAITVKDELKEIKHLLNLLKSEKREQDEIVVLWDGKNGSEDVWEYLESEDDYISYHRGEFKGHFANWKNELTSKCYGDYIFQIDADEFPSPFLIHDLPLIINQNPDNEVYLVPRVNTVEGLTQEHIDKWGWKVSEDGVVNWPDYQWRIWKNSTDIVWVNKVHEVLKGHKTFAPLPTHSDDYALFHPKTIGRQEKQNNYYNTL